MQLPKTESTSIYTEAIAGITTFFTMAYIIVVNPSVLSTGRRREIHPLMYALALVAVGLLLLEHAEFS